MRTARNLSKVQFRRKRDPGTNVRNKPHFTAAAGSKTMGIDKPKGMPKPPAIHPHSSKSVKRSRRAR